jgi:hypothetical protein
MADDGFDRGVYEFEEIGRNLYAVAAGFIIVSRHVVAPTL